MGELTKTKYNKLIEKISELVTKSRTELARTINTAIVNTYWTIGKYIVEYEQKGKERADYGSELMKILSMELLSKLGKGFSQRNLRDMRRMYLAYPKWQAVSAELSWSHYCVLLNLPNKQPREFNKVSAL